MIFEYKDLKINYEIFESEEAKGSTQKPLLLLHGWMGKIESWAPVYLFFSKKRKVYVLDFPGQGGMSSELTEAWGVPEYSDMTKAFIENCKIEGCDVMGHSFGGRVIIYLASRYKELFDKVLLVDGAGVKKKLSLKTKFKIFTYKVSKKVLKVFLSKEKYDKKVEEMRKKRGSSDYNALSSDLMRQTFSKIVNLDLTPCLKDINNSTLLIWGANDQETPLYMAKEMENRIKDSGLVVFENAGHFSYLDDTSRFLTIADQFFK